MKKGSTAQPVQLPEPVRSSAPHYDWKRIAITLFLLFHLVAITSWCLPLNSLLLDRFKQTIRPYIIWSGLFRAWDMFAPDPAKVNSYVDAEVTFRDGTRQMWQLPRMNEIGLIDRYFKERYRKYGTEYLRMDSHAALWPDAARYIARLYRNPGNPPVVVRLIREWSEIPAPARDGIYRPGPWGKYAYYSYLVQPGDLQ